MSKAGCQTRQPGRLVADAETTPAAAGIEDNLRSLGVERLAAVNLRPKRDEPDQLFTDQLGAAITARDEAHRRHPG